jgi:hypothetical protein
MPQVRQIEFQQLTSLRTTSQKVSQFLHESVVEYLTTLAPLLSPAKILGGYMDGQPPGRVAGADEARTAIEQQFAKMCREAFNVSAVLPSPLPRISLKLKAYPWEYPYDLNGSNVTITSPVSWVITYDLPYDLSNLLRSAAAKEKPEPDQVKQLVINTLTMQIAINRQRGIRRLFHDLRFEVEERTSPVAGAMPFVVVRSTLESFRPQDELIQTVIQLSGRPVFEELIDPAALGTIPDPLTERLRQLALS